MHNTTERLLFYLLGCVLGQIVGILAGRVVPLARYASMLKYVHPVAILLGLILAMVVVEYRHEKMLTKSNKIRQEVTTLLTHEMRTGLTSTGWAIELILEKYEDKLTAGDIQLLKSITNSIHATVMNSINLLDVSRLDAGKLSISLEKTNLGKVEIILHEAIDKYALGASKKEIAFRSTVSLDKGKEAELDLLRVRIITENLLENAVQYTVLNKKEITVNVTNDERYLYISVSDTGIGIPENEKDNIYKEFFRASNARKNLTNGSGIGLYTCSEYAKAHGGSIKFDSKENVGTTFQVSIPLTQEK